MSTYFIPAKRIKVSDLERICDKYSNLTLEEIQQPDFTSNEIQFVIQSAFSKSLLHPYKEFKNEKSNFIIVYSRKDQLSEADYFVESFRMTGSDPYHIIEIIQYETAIVINDEYTIADLKNYELNENYIVDAQKFLN